MDKDKLNGINHKEQTIDGDNIVPFDKAAQNKPVKKKNRGAAPPQVRRGLGESDEDKALISRLLKEALVAYNMPKVKSDDELAARWNQYFSMCAENGQIPTVEEMAMYSGFTQATVWDWENGRRQGFSSQTAEIVKKAKEYLKSFDAKLVISGKLNFLAYCFRAKNYYGMSDKQEIEFTAQNGQDQDMSAEDIAKRYLEDGKTVETGFADSDGE